MTNTGWFVAATVGYWTVFPSHQYFDATIFTFCTHLELYGFEEDEEGGSGVVLHVVVQAERQPVGQHLLHDRLGSAQHQLRVLRAQGALDQQHQQGSGSGTGEQQQQHRQQHRPCGDLDVYLDLGVDLDVDMDLCWLCVWV